MSSTIKRKQFDVTFSFAEEDRPFVERVNSLLKSRNISCFYDDDQRIESWGQDLSIYLDEVYRKKSKFCVIFISHHYVQKRWTLFEHRRAQARAFFMENKAYLLPFRLDDARLEGLEDSIAYLSRPQYDEQMLADAIIGKLEYHKPKWMGLWTRTLFLLKRRYRLAIIFSLTLTLSLLALTGKFTPVEVLARQLHEKSRITDDGAVCRDGTISHAQGPGTCSYHGGVDHYTDSTLYLKTMEECREEAARISWLPAAAKETADR